MSTTPDRRAELIAAAAADELTVEEARELDAARAEDATIDPEIAELRALIGTVTAGLSSWDDSAPSAAVRDNVVGIPELWRPTGVPAPVEPVDAEPTPVAVGRASTGRVRRALPVLAAAAALLVGVGIGALALPHPQPDTPLGVPGELGARELIDFADEPAGVHVDGTIVAHTWGTETILEIDGLPVGQSYTVVVLGDDGSLQSSGSFLGADATIDCRMNAALLRPDATAVEIRDAAGNAVATATLPAVA